MAAWTNNQDWEPHAETPRPSARRDARKLVPDG